MSILKSTPVYKFIDGKFIKTSDISIISEREYNTNGEGVILVKRIPECILTLDSQTTDSITIKSLTKTIIKPDRGLIDEEWSELEINKGTSVQFQFMGGSWYILGSDGIKWN
jgi:hypothetical protein